MRTACLLWRHRRACAALNTTDSWLKGARGVSKRFAGAACDLVMPAPPAAPAEGQAAASHIEGSGDGTLSRACLLSVPGCAMALTHLSLYTCQVTAALLLEKVLRSDRRSGEGCGGRPCHSEPGWPQLCCGPKGFAPGQGAQHGCGYRECCELFGIVCLSMG